MHTTRLVRLLSRVHTSPVACRRVNTTALTDAALWLCSHMMLLASRRRDINVCCIFLKQGLPCSIPGAATSRDSTQQLSLSRLQVLAERSTSQIWRAPQIQEPWQQRAGCRQWHRQCIDSLCDAYVADEGEIIEPCKRLIWSSSQSIDLQRQWLV